MFTEPADTPVTTPPDETVALALLALHTPPDTGFVSVMAAPSHTKPGPEILPAVIAGPIVTVVEETSVPQALVTV